MTKPPVTANRTARPVLDRVFLNGATIMSTTTPDQIEVARRTGFAGVEVRVERLLGRHERFARHQRRRNLARSGA